MLAQMEMDPALFAGGAAAVTAAFGAMTTVIGILWKKMQAMEVKMTESRQAESKCNAELATVKERLSWLEMSAGKQDE